MWRYSAPGGGSPSAPNTIRIGWGGSAAVNRSLVGFSTAFALVLVFFRLFLPRFGSHSSERHSFAVTFCLQPSCCLWPAVLGMSGR